MKREGKKQVYVAWVNQANGPVYTPLKVMKPGLGTTEVPGGLAGVAFTGLVTQMVDNIDDLAVATLTGPAVVVIS